MSVEAQASSSVLRRLDSASKDLLDLSLRNRMVKFRPTQRLHLQLQTASAARLAAALRADEPKPVRLEPIEPSRGAPAAGEGGRRAITATESHEQAVDRTVADRGGSPPAAEVLGDGVYYIPADGDDERAPRVLLHDAKLFEGEHGYSALFVAIGMVSWTESAGAPPLHAPLLLYPVTLQRGPRNRGFVIQGTGDPPALNPALTLKVREQEVFLPDEAFVEGATFDEVVSEVEQAIARKGWHVRPEAWLGMFNFHKFVMYQDLRALIAMQSGAKDMPGAVRAVLDPEPDDPRLDTETVLGEEELDERIDWLDARYILDADPSQIVAIEEVKAGKHLVIQGPPGTGKSQTIANLIAELLGTGKTVLFVSEKEAALEVVKRRLDDAGLGDFCLALHGVKTSHEQFRSQMKAVVEGAFRLPAGAALDAGEFQATLATLDGYAQALRSPPPGSDLTLGWALGTLAAVRERAPGAPVIGARSADVPSRQHLDEALVLARDRMRWATAYGAAAENPWSWSSARDATLINGLNGVYQQLASAMDGWRRQAASFADAIGEPAPRTQDDFDRCLRWRDELGNARSMPSIEAEADLSEMHAFAQECMSLLADFITQRDRLAKRGVDWRTETLAAPLRTDLETASARPLHWLRPSYWRARRTAMSVYLERPVFRHAQILDDLADLAGFQERVPELEPLHDGVRRLGIESDDWDVTLEAVTVLLAWLTHVLAALEMLEMPPRLVKAMGDPDEAEQLAYAITQTESAWNGVALVLGDIDRMTVPHATAPFGDASEPTPGVAQAFLEWYPGAKPALAPWLTLQDWKARAAAAWLNGLTRMEPTRAEEARLEDGILYTVAEAVLNAGTAAHPELNLFSAADHESTQRRFRDLDQRLAKRARHELAKQLAGKAKQVVVGAFPGSPMHAVRAELIKKRKRKPIRQVVKEGLPALKALKPCFMMSPITVSTYLDPQAEPFDVLVFDEASQVRPEDALVCLMRARQVVVVGDSRQLPPTSFFDAAEADEGHERLSDMESILDVCATSGFPEKTLRWHYRSRHHSLIEGSNQEFYHRQLLVFHSPRPKAPGFGLRHHYFAGVYGEGGQGVNRGEAQEIARLVHEHWVEHGLAAYHGDGTPRSLGVVAFSQAQMRAIQDELYLTAPADPAFQTWIDGHGDEPFFVKNLENVQGDERDRIIISIGYGRDAKGQIKRNFGPVNQQGGERRLNVLFTRAREQAVVVSNFRAAELDLEGVGGRGPHVLKRFLELAQTGTWPEADPPGDAAPSRFETAVKEMLEEHGYEVTSQVGCLGYRIDLAVHHPDAPAQYCLAIECDGATYQESRVARERDRQRQDVLQRMGWRVARVWSTEWYHRPQAARERLLAAVRAASEVDPQAKRPREAPIDVEAPSVAVHLAHAPQFVLPEYEQAAPRLAGPLADIPRDEMGAVIRDVLAVEAPMHVEALVERLRDASGQRMGPRARDAIMDGINYLENRGEATLRDDVLRVPGRLAEPRRRPPGWNAAWIASDEIEAVLGAIATQALAVPVEDAFQVAREAFGYARLGKEMRAAFEAALEDALAAGRMSRSEGMLRCEEAQV